MSYIKGDNEQEQKDFDFLERLRQSGKTNMLAAATYLIDSNPSRFYGNHGVSQASQIVGRWIELHNDPERCSDRPWPKEEPA